MPKTIVERRNLLGAELRAEGSGDEMILAGRACAYNVVSSHELQPGLREKVLPGAFRASLAAPDSDVKALVNHDPSRLLGRQKNRTLTLDDLDERGLYVRVMLNPESQFHVDTWQAVKRGDMNEMSFAFIAEDESVDADNYEGKRCMVRSVRKAALADISAVTYPFYGQGATQIMARSLEDSKKTGKPYIAYKVTAFFASDADRRAHAERIGKEIREQCARDKAEAERFAREQKQREAEIRESMKPYILR